MNKDRPSPSVGMGVNKDRPSPSVGMGVNKDRPSPSVDMTVNKDRPSPSVGMTLNKDRPSPSVGMGVNKDRPSPSVGMGVNTDRPSPMVVTSGKGVGGGGMGGGGQSDIRHQTSVAKQHQQQLTAGWRGGIQRVSARGKRMAGGTRGTSSLCQPLVPDHPSLLTHRHFFLHV